MGQRCEFKDLEGSYLRKCLKAISQDNTLKEVFSKHFIYLEV